MKSGDTNLLLYAMNRGCAEHDRARAWLDAALAEPREWIFSDQVLFEPYPADLVSLLDAGRARSG